MAHQIRQPWSIMYASILALIIRDIQNKFIKTVNTQRSLGFIWIIFEPILHISLWMAIRLFFGHQFYSSPYLSYPLFILLGAISFFYFRNIISVSKGCIKGNKNYYLFRQIKPIDPIIAKIISELLINIVVFIVMLGLFTWFGSKWHIYNFLFWIGNIVAYSFFLLGLSLIISIACFFLNFIETILKITMRITYFLSGIFFSAEMLPKNMRDIVLYNPVFQFIELSRDCFKPDFSYVPYASSIYLYKSALITLLFGLSFYVLFREKIMTEIEQR